jgi:hypothetical protein
LVSRQWEPLPLLRVLLELVLRSSLQQKLSFAPTTLIAVTPFLALCFYSMASFAPWLDCLGQATLQSCRRHVLQCCLRHPLQTMDLQKCRHPSTDSTNSLIEKAVTAGFLMQIWTLRGSHRHFPAACQRTLQTLISVHLGPRDWPSCQIGLERASRQAHLVYFRWPRYGERPDLRVLIVQESTRHEPMSSIYLYTIISKVFTVLRLKNDVITTIVQLRHCGTT